jgi:serpin B
MPELKLASNTSLIDPLATMGMAPVFVNADFSRMLGAFGATNQAVGVVQQAVTLNVNQWGTDAAAGTVVSVIPSDAHSSTPIAFNHPYLFLIRDTRTGTLLFSSVVNNPAAG